MSVSLAIFLWQNSSLIKNHNLLENFLLFPTEITNLLFVIKTRQPLKQNFMLNCKKTMIKKKDRLQLFSEKIFPSGDFHPNENHRLLDNPLILPQAKILISFWSQKAENQKFEIEENVMSEPVKMPIRHFLRRDYLHIFFYSIFLVFVSLVY